jgi:putative peptidoglycan lipid II flippase
VLGYRGVALGTSLAATANFAVLAVAWRRRHGSLGAGVFRQLGRVVAASLALAAVAWATERGLAALLPVHKSLPRQLALAFGPIVTVGVAYLAAARALGIPELDELLGVLRKRRAKRAAVR